jgi:hypothetical protein
VCNVTGAGGIEFAGNGSGRLPYIPSWSLFNLIKDDSSQTDITITGTGTVGDPWIITIDTLGGSVIQTVYNNNDTWVKGSGTVCNVVAIGAGGGGGGVGEDASFGGSGGAGGAMSVGWFAIDDLPDTVEIEVGTGGTGGRPESGLTTAADGGDSWFGEYLLAPGGRGGKSQASPSQTAHTTLGGTYPEGGSGGAGAIRSGSSVVDAEGHYTSAAPTGGGVGEGSLTAATGEGDLAIHMWGGAGGRGGSPSILGPGNPGQDYGGGGGGGSSSPTTSYRGGDGADGVVVVTVW